MRGTLMTESVYILYYNVYAFVCIVSIIDIHEHLSGTYPLHLVFNHLLHTTLGSLTTSSTLLSKIDVCIFWPSILT